MSPPSVVVAQLECLLATTGELGALPTLLVMGMLSGRESFFVGEAVLQSCMPRERERARGDERGKETIS